MEALFIRGIFHAHLITSLFCICYTIHMKRPVTISIIVILGIVLAVASYVFLPKYNTYSSNTSSPSTEISSLAPTDTQSSPSASSSTGEYVDYSENIISSTSGTKVLFFHAPWCPQCRALDESIKAGPIPDGVTIIKVDYDSNQALRQKYGVTTQTTLVRVDDNGNIVTKYVAYDSPTLESLITNTL
jgi:thiol-disulfide isomerase/thioredoxin